MKVSGVAAGVVGWLALSLAALGADGSKAVRFTVDTSRDVRPISPYVYGMNAHGAEAGQFHTRPLSRLGGNRWTAYNWENNASNAGRDWHHQSDGYLSESDVPGEAVRPALEAAGRNRQALIVTVPMAGYVSADKGPDGDVNKTPGYLEARFHESVAKKGRPFELPPDVRDRVVYQDEFVHWVETAGRVEPKQVIFYALDNEPDLWSETHERIHPRKVTYAELVGRTTEWARGIKDVRPDAQVFGFVSYGWNGMRTLQDAPDAGGRDFTEYFLAEMRKAEGREGRRLVDVLDVHWYPEARGGDVRIIERDVTPAAVAARVQAPRSLWDPTYTESSWITEHSTKGPIRLIPRLKEMIGRNYPGTKLAITEYTYGAGDHISGGVATADALGIFGREGVFAAAWWNTNVGVKYVDAALDVYLNFDGKGGRFGDTSVLAETDDIESSAVYAATDVADASRVTVVMINRSERPLAARAAVTHRRGLTRARLFRMDGSAAAVRPAGEMAVGEGNALACVLPPMSVTAVLMTEGK